MHRDRFAPQPRSAPPPSRSPSGSRRRYGNTASLALLCRIEDSTCSRNVRWEDLVPSKQKRGQAPLPDLFIPLTCPTLSALKENKSGRGACPRSRTPII